MKTIWPRSLAGRLIIWLMLVFTLALSFVFFTQRINNQRLLVKITQEAAANRMTMVSRILEQGEVTGWTQTLLAANSDDLRLSFLDEGNINSKPSIAKDQPQNSGQSTPSNKGDEIIRKFSVIIPSLSSDENRDERIWIIEHPIDKDGKSAVRKVLKIKNTKRTFTFNINDTRFKDQKAFFEGHIKPNNNGPENGPLIKAMMETIERDQAKLQSATVDLALKLDDGRWLKGAFKPRVQPLWSWNGVFFLGILMFAIGGVIVLVVRAETRPMQRLAQAAEALGRGEHLPPLEEKGPHEIRLAVEAFNLMGDRLGRFMQDRTRMLAAMSHDLRTPLTTLRLRAEMIDEPEARQKLIETIEEMHRITEASLSFAREEDNTEETRETDLSALVLDLCEEAKAMGKDAALANQPPPITARIRPAAMRRAVRNLIDNAVRYGTRACVTIETDKKEARIIIDDDGPGIDDAQREDVFSPFVRLENSRNTDTGGTGLGLSIARTIARSHGGDVVLENRENGGLRAILCVPAETS